jgi:AraC-like DNA-binding protein
MVGIAFEAGFNSKTAFYTAFKKTTGLSPTEFKTINKP